MLMQLYLVTNRKQCLLPLPEVVRQAAGAGVNGIILREKDLTSRELYELALPIRKITGETGTTLIVADRLEVAMAVQADGVLLGYSSLPPGVVKQTIGYRGEIWASVHSPAEARQAQQNGATALVAGHIFTTDCKPGLNPRGISFLKEILAQVTIPVIAIGGITPSTAPSLIGSGAAGVAVMSYINNAQEPSLATRKLLAVFTR